MLISRPCLEKMLLSTADLWRSNMDMLSDVDSRFGDGDHGVTIGKIAALMTTAVADWKNETLHDFIESLGDSIMSVSGGSAGPLYGTMIGGMAGPLNDEKEIDGPLLKKMLCGSRDSLFEITKAREGDKTMLDALIPAVKAAMESSGDVKDILAEAAKAAAAGAEATKGQVSKFGRARSYGEQTLGTADAGALSTALLFQGFYEGCV